MSKNNFIKSFTMSQTAMALTVALGMKKDNVTVDELIEQCRAALPKHEVLSKPAVKKKNNLCPSCKRGVMTPGFSGREKIEVLSCKACTYSKMIRG